MCNLTVRALFFLCVSVLGLSGCTLGWNEDECRHTNWYNFGRKEGAAATSFNIDKVMRQCEKDFEVHIDRAKYADGFDSGLRDLFCTVQHGETLGRGGYEYQNQCLRVGKDSEFKEGWLRGLKQWCKISNVKQRAIDGRDYPTWCRQVKTAPIAQLDVAYREGTRIRRQRNEIQSQIYQVTQDINERESQLSSYNAGSRRYIEIQGQIDNLNSQLNDLRRRQYDVQ